MMFGRRQNAEVAVLDAERISRREGPLKSTSGGARVREGEPSVVDTPAAKPVTEPAAKPVSVTASAVKTVSAALRGISEPTRDDIIESVTYRAEGMLNERVQPVEGLDMPRGDLAGIIGAIIDEVTANDPHTLSPDEHRDTITVLINQFLGAASDNNPNASGADGGNTDRRAGGGDGKTSTNLDSVKIAKEVIQPILMERMDVAKANELPRGELARQISDIVSEIVGEEKIQLNVMEQRDLVTTLLNDMLGLGPLEPLLADPSVTDVLVNGPGQVYIERRGKLELTDVTFRDNRHVMNIATRIVTQVGRRVDESTPLVDARLADGSRVNIIIPPLAIDGATISIRKFAKQKITLDIMEQQLNLSPQMATVLKIAARAQLNILISGGTGSGKTTLLNAMSRMIDPGERIVTIEDAAELQLQQPHVVRLETRPPNLEGGGEITQRELVKNALRMRPDRIILGEIRAGEALDMLQAMNTGHDGSMCTIHANRPRESLTRLENMVAMAGVKLPNEAVRGQIAGAINLIVQISRMRDGVRRITQITEVVGIEGDIITTQDLFTFEFKGEDADGRLLGEFTSSGLRPHFMVRAQYFGLDRALLEAMT